jgi:hypothetical protein
MSLSEPDSLWESLEMDCPHCGIAFHDHWTDGPLNNTGHDRTYWATSTTMCAACQQAIIKLRKLEIVNKQGTVQHQKVSEFVAYPRNTFRKPSPQEVPPTIKEDYEQACAVLSISEKASAALARRCLQAILRAHGYPQHDLAKQIEAVLKESDPAKAIPTSLRTTVDAIRNFGNFSAHPITDQTTLQVIDVETGEAEWCLEILEEMFDHYYVKPAQAALRKAALDAKLAAAGKPPSR